MIHNIKYLNNNEKPIVAIVGCVHGDELIGKKVITALKKVKIKKGILYTIIGNEKAVGLKKRFVDQDLNRSFPGKEKGNHEERLAYKLKNKIADADYVIDIHSTVTEVKDLVIVARKNKKTLALLDLFHPKKVTLVPGELGRKSLIYYCKAGISLEYGKDKDDIVYKKILRDIMTMLKKMGMVEFEIRKTNKKQELYRITGIIKKKKGFVLNDKIKNFKLIKKGEIIALMDDCKIKAKDEFYPILFGKNSYEESFGFVAKKIKKF